MLWTISPRRSTTIVAFPVLLTGLLFVEPQTESKLTFAPRVGSSVAKQADFSIEFHTLTLSLGEEQNSTELASTQLSLRTSGSFTDTYIELGEGRPIELWRKFDKLSGTWEEADRRNDIGGFSALSGCTVRYRWSPASQAFERNLKEGAAPGIRVADLVEDQDLRGFTPAEAVKVGAKWTARGQPVMDALFGATEFGLAGITEEHSFEDDLNKFILKPFRVLGNQQVEFTCQRVEDESLNGTRARIDLSQQQRLRVQITEQLNEYVRAEFGSHLQVDLCQLDWAVDGKGHVLWNTDLHRFESLDFKAAVDLVVLVEVSVASACGGESCLTIRMHAEGEALWSTRVLD